MFGFRRSYLWVLFPICLSVFGLSSDSWAQNRVIARVEPNKDKFSNTAEIFDPAGGSFSPAAGTMFVGRMGHTETRLFNGKVLLAGGINDTSYLDTAEIYDPQTNTFAETTKVDATTSETAESKLNAARTGHTATLLLNGLVLIIGGYNGSYLNSAELYNPSTGVFTQVSETMNEARAFHRATLLPDGQVLISGGYNGSYLNTLEIYNPNLHKFIAIAATTGDTRAYHTATLMSTGEVLIAGGSNSDGYLNSAVIYNPSSQASRTLASSLTVARSNHSALALSDGSVFIAGGSNGSALATAETFNPSTSTFTAITAKMTTAREGFTETLLANGKVLLVGGSNGSQLATAEIYDPTGKTFTATPGSMAFARRNHTATLLADGRVVVTGGQTGKLLTFDVNMDTTDNVAPNIVFPIDSTVGFVSFTGSGAVVAFSAVTGEVLNTIQTGGKPAWITPLPGGRVLAVVSVLDNKIFLIDAVGRRLISTLTFTGAEFGFGSVVAVARNGTQGYVSSTGSGEVIKFSLPGGNELGRLTGLQAPAQIAITPDDSTLIVVDAISEQLVFTDSASMKQKYVLKATETDSGADFSMSNNVALSADGDSGIIASQGLNAEGSHTVFVFKVSTGAVLTTRTTSNKPGYAALTPDGQDWVILTEYSIFKVPVADPDSSEEISGQSSPLTSSNLVFSQDSRYVYYPSATFDLFVKQDLTSHAFTELNVGDENNQHEDQTASVAVTPDGQTFAALNFITNNIAIITTDTLLNSSRFDIGAGKFNGLSLINPTLTPIKVKITAMSDFGSALTNTNSTNPVDITLPPNGQLSTTVEQLFNLDSQTDQTGWLLIVKDQPGLVGYTSFGRVRGSWLGSFIELCDGSPVFTDLMYDWIIPEVSRQSGASTELSFVNPNYNSATFDLSRIVKDGSVIATTAGTAVSSKSRLSQSFAKTYTQAQANDVLIVGGENSTGTLNSAEYSDLSGGSFTATTGALNQAVKSQMAVLLSNGKVLTAGGRDGGNNILNNAETYDPVASAFALTTGAMNIGRYRGTATLLPDGRVLIAGGQTPQTTTNTAEIYDPTSEAFSLTASSMTSARSDHTATLLPNGKILIAGGSDGNAVLDTAELFDPGSGTFARTGTMTTRRAFHTATLLANGQVLITGGYNGGYVNTAEVYNPATGLFTATATPMTRARAYHTATLLDDGRVLVAGGTDGTSYSDRVDLYDPEINSFLLSEATLNTARKGHAAVLLSDGKVLILGGTDGTNVLDSAEIYDPVVDSLTKSSSSMTAARNNFTATLLANVTEGYLRATSTQGMTFSEFYGGTTPMATLNGIDMSKFSGVTTLYSPQFATGSGFKTILNVINGNENTAEITITLHNSDGSVIGNPAAVTLAPGAQLRDDLTVIFGNDARVQIASGWLEINSDVDEVVGTISFTNSNGDFLTSYELQGNPANDLVIPLAAQDDTYLTGISVLNATSDTAVVAAELWTPDGTLYRSSTVSLAPGTRMAKYLSQLFSNLGQVHAANVRIHSDKPVFAFGLLHDKDVHFLAALPGISIQQGK